MVQRAIALIAICVAAIGLLSAWAASDPTSVAPRVLLAAVVLVGAFGSLVLRKRSEKKTRTSQEGSIERGAAIKAQAAVFVDGLIGTALLGAVLLIFGRELNGGAVAFGLLALLVIDFYIRFAVLRSGRRDVEE